MRTNFHIIFAYIFQVLTFRAISLVFPVFRSLVFSESNISNFIYYWFIFFLHIFHSIKLLICCWNAFCWCLATKSRHTSIDSLISRITRWVVTQNAWQKCVFEQFSVEIIQIMKKIVALELKCGCFITLSCETFNIFKIKWIIPPWLLTMDRGYLEDWPSIILRNLSFVFYLELLRENVTLYS